MPLRINLRPGALVHIEAPEVVKFLIFVVLSAKDIHAIIVKAGGMASAG